MMWVQMVLRALVGDAREETQRKRRVRLFVALFGLVTLLGLAGTGWVIAQAGIHGWQTEDWDRLSSASFLPFPCVFAVVILPLILVALNITISDFAQPLRELVASGDMRLSYPGMVQPLPLAPQEIAVGGQTFQRLRVAEGGLGYQRVFGVVPGLIVMSMLALENLPSALGTEGASGNSIWPIWFVPVAFLTGMVAIVGAMVVMIRAAFGAHTRLSITADEHGLTWRRGKRGITHQIGWHAVRSFSVMAYQDTSGFSLKRTAFLVDGGDAQLAWTLYSSSGQDEHGESWQLSRHIVTRSGHVLRDLTPLSASLVMTSAKPARLRSIGAPEPLIEGVAAARRRFRRYWFTSVPLFFGAVAIMTVSFIGSYSIRDYQKQYFAGLVSKIDAEKPLYHNALMADDGEWQTLPPSEANDHMSLGIVDGAYQMSAPKDQTAQWTISPVYGDVAVEVTVKLAKPAATDSGAGLILRSDYPKSDFVVFFVSPDNGSWSLDHYHYVDISVNPDKSWHSLDDGYSSFIHRGDGAANTLLALTRGDVILLYINGHFIASYSAQNRYNDNYYYGNPPLLHDGYVGVYDNQGATVVRFNDFSVYPVKSPPSLEYV